MFPEPDGMPVALTRRKAQAEPRARPSRQITFFSIFVTRAIGWFALGSQSQHHGFAAGLGGIRLSCPELESSL